MKTLREKGIAMAITHFFNSYFICPRALLVFAIISFLSACNTPNNPDTQTSLRPADSVAGQSYAIGFELIREKNLQKLHMFRHHNGDTDTIAYLLCDQNQVQPEGLTNYRRINVPARKIALLHTSYYSYFTVCEATGSIAAISEAKYLYDSEMYGNVKAGIVPQVSFGENLNKEKLLELGVDLVINVGFPDTPNKNWIFWNLWEFQYWFSANGRNLIPLAGQNG
ncbi:MAG: hypothetical protein U5K79_01365 [Cyclobacteriaceae bacterium]|nr:hypothetical protein [Cyclobacteriaceae bacterium]